MASSNREGHYQPLPSYKDHEEKSIARSALMWLCNAARPLRASELWTAAQIRDCDDVEHVEHLLTDKASVDDHEAMLSLRSLLGDLMDFIEDPLHPSQILVKPATPEMRVRRSIPGLASEADAMRETGFSADEGQMAVASVCMAICSVSTLHLAHVGDDSTTSSLILYAWTHWHTHLSLGGLDLEHPAIARVADQMVLGLSRDVMLFLLAVGDCLSRRISLPLTAGHLECSALILQAQKALERVLINISVTLRTAYLFGDKERRTVRNFAEAARGLRALCISLANPIIYEQILELFEGEWSPMEILGHTADMMDILARYPSREGLAVDVLLGPSSLSDKGKNDNAARPALGSLATMTCSSSSRAPQPAALASSTMKPAEISTLRWYLASLVFRFKGASVGYRPEAMLIVNHGRSTSQQTSSFAALPGNLYTPSRYSLRRLGAFISTSLERFFRKQGIKNLDAVRHYDIARSIHSFCTSAFTFESPTDTPQLKSAFLSDGYRVALFQATVAILIHHIRRTLTPWLGAFLFYHPMEDLRLALTNPDVFLDQTLSCSWSWVAASFLQSYILDVVAIPAMNLLLANNGRLPNSALDFLRGKPRAVTVSFEGLMHLCKIGYGVYMLIMLDYIFCRSMHAVSCLIALRKLLFGGDGEHLALQAALKTHWHKAPVLSWMLWHYLRYAMLPVLVGSVSSALRGQPGLLLVLSSVVGGVGATITWRTRLYIALEMSGMFVVLGLFVAVVVLLAVEFVDDPLGLKASTDALGRRLREVTAALPAGTKRRIKILGQRRSISHDREGKEGADLIKE